MSAFRRLTLNIVVVQATIDKRHYAVIYLGDDEHGNNYLKIYLNGVAVSSIIWDRSLKSFRNLRWTIRARNEGFEENFVWPNEVRKKLLRKLTENNLFRLVRINVKKPGEIDPRKKHSY